MDDFCRYLLVFIAFVLSVGALAGTEVRTPHGLLRLESRTTRNTASTVRGKFTAHSGNGIQFTSSQDHLSIASSEGEPILHASRAAGGERFGYYNVSGVSFVEAESRAYAVPRNQQINMQNYLEKTRDLLAELQEQGEDEHVAIAQRSYRNFVASPEAPLIVHAAKGHGENYGMVGSEHPAILPFYAVALGIARARRDTSAEEEMDSDRESYFDTVRTQGRYPNCNRRSCPPCRNDHCMGMCGPDCTCWWWVCGDCCYHRGCGSHDSCCRNRGFISWECLSIALGGAGFSCRGNYDCSRFWGWDSAGPHTYSVLTANVWGHTYPCSTIVVCKIATVWESI